MSYKSHNEDMKRGKIKVNNFVAKHDHNKGSGPHMKPYKARRTAVKRCLKCDLESIMNDEYDMDIEQ